MTKADVFIPVERRPYEGRVKRWIEEVLKSDPGVWHRYPYEVARPHHMVAKYGTRYYGTEWALDADGHPGARWVGIDSITELA